MTTAAASVREENVREAASFRREMQVYFTRLTGTK
jgi:hypothetical protein